MLMNLANYLNNDFPFHMFFAMQILLAEGLFVVRMKSRLRPLKIVLPVVLCYLVLGWFHPMLGHRFVRVAAFPLMRFSIWRSRSADWRHA